jgi:hypothetical protein
MWEPNSGINLCGVNRKIPRSSNLEIMFYGFAKKKNIFKQIQEKMVWSIHGTILLTQ